MKLNHLLLCVLLTSGGCYIGSEEGIPMLAYRPAGIRVMLQTAEGGIAGELLAVRSGELVMLTPNPDRLLIVPFASIRSGNAILVGDFRSSDLRGGTLVRLRRVSRYPQGIDSELEASLLTAYGLTRMERVEP